MRCSVYALKSEKNGDIYVGSAKNVKHRLTLHNNGRVKSTRGYRPWKLMEQQEFDSRSEALRKEHFLKNGQQKEALRKKYIWPSGEVG